MKHKIHRLFHRLRRDHTVRHVTLSHTWIDYWGEAGTLTDVFICTCGMVW
ncbi:hypothetical protein SEA_HOLT_50 [Mycobacterium Phage Holt]|nr:hypothetical protein SEA_HOLT_50 [Mycobacterium Phage Holt]